jgi:isocitrate lyase
VPNPDDEVEVRLAILETEVARLREHTLLISSDAATARADAAAARVLASGADRDVSEVRAELRAHIQALNALRETQLEQAREMREGFAEVRAEMREGFAEIHGDLAGIHGDLAEMREGFAKQAIGMDQITALLTKIAEPEGHR